MRVAIRFEHTYKIHLHSQTFPDFGNPMLLSLAFSSYHFRPPKENVHAHWYKLPKRNFVQDTAQTK